MAYGKLTTASLPVQSQCQIKWLMANSQQHLFLYSPSVKLYCLWQTHNNTFFCTVPVSSSMAYGPCLRKGCNQEAATTAKPGSHVLSLSRWARCSNPACVPRWPQHPLEHESLISRTQPTSSSPSWPQFTFSYRIRLIRRLIWTWDTACFLNWRERSSLFLLFVPFHFFFFVLV